MAMDEAYLRALLDKLDEATRERVAQATQDTGGNSRLACDGARNGIRCTDVLYHCYQCNQVGCRTEGCSQRLYNHNNVCERCGAHGGMNRFVKLSSVYLWQAWWRFHRPGA